MDLESLQMKVKTWEDEHDLLLQTTSYSKKKQVTKNTSQTASESQAKPLAEQSGSQPHSLFHYQFSNPYIQSKNLS